MSRRIPGVSGPHADATLVTGGAPVAAAEVAVVLVHGRGGTAEGLIRLADEFYRSGATLLAPGAVRSTWFPAPHEAPLSANEPSLTSAVDCVDSAVGVARDAGVPPERVVLVGVSQGGAVVAEFLRRRPRRFGGAFVVSAALPGEDLDSREVEGSGGEGSGGGGEGSGGGGEGSGGGGVGPGSDGGGPLAETPVALDSTEDDPYVPAGRVRATARVFERAGAAVECRIDPGDGHGLSDATMDRIGDRIAGLLADG